MTAIEAPYPIRNMEKLSLYIVTARVSEDLYGPPLEITYMMSKVLNELTMACAITTVVIGLSMGNVTYLKVCQGLAPSIIDASTGSDGTVVRPMRKSTILFPVCCHVQAMIMENVLRGTAFNHWTFMSSPHKSVSNPLRIPELELNMLIQIIPVETNDMARGKKIMVLNTCSPLMPRIKMAINKPPNTGNTSVEITHKVVLKNDLRKFGS